MQDMPDKSGHSAHKILTDEEKLAIRIAIERYKQTGKFVSLKEVSSVKKGRKQ